VDTLTSRLSTSLKSLIRRLTRPFALPSLDREMAAQAHREGLVPTLTGQATKSVTTPLPGNPSWPMGTPTPPPMTMRTNGTMTPVTTAGATSEGEPDKINHAAKLVEQHRITLPVGATGDNVAVARLHAEAYARARGFEIKPGSFNVLSHLSPAHGEERIGVSFELVVGTGDIDTSQHTERWTWGGAIDWWRRLMGPDQPEGKLLSLVDEAGRRRGGRITGMRPGTPGSEGFEVEGRFTDGGQPSGFSGFANPGWLGPDALRGFDAAKGLGMFDAVDQSPPWMSRADGDDSEGE